MATKNSSLSKIETKKENIVKLKFVENKTNQVNIDKNDTSLAAIVDHKEN